MSVCIPLDGSVYVTGYTQQSYRLKIPDSALI